MAKQPNPSNSPIVESIPLDAHGRPMAEYPDADSAIDWTRVDYGKLVDPPDATTGRTRLGTEPRKGLPAEDPLKTPRSLMVLFLIAVIAVLAIALLKAQKTPVVPASTFSPSATKPPLDFDRMVRERSRIAQVGNSLALDLFRIEVERAKAVHLAMLAIPTDGAAEVLATYRSISQIIYYLAWDEITKENRTEEYLKTTAAPILDPGAKSFGAILDSAGRKLDSDLRISTTRLAYDLATISRGDGQAQSKATISALSEPDFQQALRNLKFNAAGVGVGVAFDGYALASLSPALVNKLTAMSGRMFSKQGARLAGSGAVAIMDGPLPLGDIIAVVATLWTVYDMHSMKEEFHTEIQIALSNSLSQAAENAVAQANASATAREQTYAKLQARMGRQTLQQLSKGRT